MGAKAWRPAEMARRPTTEVSVGVVGLGVPGEGTDQLARAEGRRKPGFPIRKRLI